MTKTCLNVLSIGEANHAPKLSNYLGSHSTKFSTGGELNAYYQISSHPRYIKAETLCMLISTIFWSPFPTGKHCLVFYITSLCLYCSYFQNKHNGLWLIKALNIARALTKPQDAHGSCNYGNKGYLMWVCLCV